MKRADALVLLSILMSMPSGARASVDAVFLPIGQPTAGLPAALTALPGVESARAVFDPAEQAFLAEQGEGEMAAAVKLEVKDSESFEALKRRKDLPGRFEINPRAKLHTLNPEQWGLANSGKPQEVTITDILSRFIQSVAGEDAGVAHAPAELPGRKILVAVVDTGVETQHPALRTQIHRTPSECVALAAFQKCLASQSDQASCHAKYDKMDTDGNGYPLDCQGWDVTGDLDARTGLMGSGTVNDAVGHGTHVSGIIAGTGFISGVSTQTEILPVRVLGPPSGGVQAPSSPVPPAPAGDLPDPHAPDFTQSSVVADVVARGVLYAIRSHAQVLNLSLGYPIHDDSELMRKMVALARARGILVVAAAGNDSSRTPVYPCRYAGVICVASFSADGSISHFSDYGDSVDIAAPGYSILSSWPMGFFPSFFTERPGYDFLSGTSMAAPFVTGALARLLNHGFGPEEAYARLILGARTSRPPTAMQELEPKFTLSGNLDLARAFAVRPQPLILPALKESILVPLDREKQLEPKTGKFQLALKNYWRVGDRVTVELRISSTARGLLQFPGEGAQLTRTFDSWKPGETRVLQGALSWSAPLSELPGEFYLEVTTSGPGLDTRTFKKAVEFVVPVRPLALVAPLAADPKITRVSTALKAEQLPDNYAIKPISCLPGAQAGAPTSDDLLLISKPGHSTILQVLKRGSGSSGEAAFKTQGGDVLDDTQEQLITFSCVDLNGDGVREYAVSTFNAHDKKFTLTYFDPLFRHARDALTISFSSDVVTMPEDFRWIAGINADHTLAPVFVTRGKKPDSELGGYNPWETRTAEQINPVDAHLYYLDKAGAHTLAPPEGFHYAALLKATRDQLVQGSATVLLYKGTDYLLDFYTAPLQGLKIGVPAKLEFSIYQRITGLTMLAAINQSASGTGGTVFAEEGTAGRMRLSVLPNSGAPRSNWLLPWVLEPIKAGDILSQVLATFGETAEGSQAFSRSRFQLYFHDRKTNTTLGTDLKQYDSVTRHLPAWVDGLPAMLLPEGEGSSVTTEVIVPRNADGKPMLDRPASLKTLGVDGCELIQMKLTGLSGSGGGMSDAARRLVYFCGDHFVEIAL